jgi:hypothetical protein
MPKFTVNVCLISVALVCLAVRSLAWLCQCTAHLQVGIDIDCHLFACVSNCNSHSSNILEHDLNILEHDLIASTTTTTISEVKSRHARRASKSFRCAGRTFRCESATLQIKAALPITDWFVCIASCYNQQHSQWGCEYRTTQRMTPRETLFSQCQQHEQNSGAERQKRERDRTFGVCR